ncbi:hypothetical protein [Coleofasciculus chthonoplastes]|uniref:hypothetical protein n=1 Tax=Coleofasciculus chthonoplastes TaxID=64178 RepID=UPI0032FEF997
MNDEKDNLSWWINVSKFLFQGYIILPILTNFILGLVLTELGESWHEIVSRVAVGMAVGLIFGVGVAFVFSLGLGFARSVLGGMVFGLMFGLMFGMTESTLGGEAFSFAVGVAFSFAVGVAFSFAVGVEVGVAFSFAVGMAFSFAVCLAFNVVFDVVVGVMIGVAVGVNSWRSIVTYPFVILWNALLYGLDKQRPETKSCFLRWHSAFWDECQRLPLPNLDKHLVLVWERNPQEGQAAFNYLNISHQRWSVQEAQIELDARKLEQCNDINAIRNYYGKLAPEHLEGWESLYYELFNKIKIR